MAIVIKVKADTKELEKDIQQAAQKAKTTLNQATAAVGGGAGGTTSKLSEEFKRLRTEGEAASKRIEAVKQGSEGLSKSAVVATTAISALAAAAVAAATAFVKMALEGSKLADTLIETAFAAGKTVEQMQKLEKGGRDLTGELRAVGGVLDFEMIKKASQATDQFAIFGKQVDALKIKLAVDLSGAFEAAGRAMQQSLLRAEPNVRDSTRRMGEAFERMIPIIARVTEASFNLFAFQMANVGRVIGAFQTPTPAASTINTTRAQQLPRFAATGELRDFLRSPEALARAQALRPTGRTSAGGVGGGARVAARAQQNVEITEEMMERIGRTMRQGLTRILDDFNAQLEDAARDQRLRDQRFAREAIQGPLDAAVEARAGRGTRTTLTERFDRQRQTRVDQTANFDARQREMEEASARLFDEVREQAVRFKQGIVLTFESAFREGFERGPKAFLQATASAIKSFFSQIAAELSTGIIELILFGRGGISGRGVSSGGALGGLGAVLGGFGGGGGGGGGGFGGLFGGGGGGVGGFISKFLGGGGGSSSTIGVAPSLAAGGFGGVAGGDFAGNLLTLSQGGTIAGAAGGGALSGFAGFAGAGGLGALAIGGLLGVGVGGKSRGGQILGGIGGALAGVAAFTGIAGALTGGVIGAVAGLAATGIGLIAAPLLIGAYFLGKAKQRRSDEQLADSIWVAERDQIRQIIQAVNADRMDGATALAEAQALRASTVSQLQQIKTKSVRDSRLQNQLRDLDNGVVAELRAAVARQAGRRRTGSFLVPEFESGGYVPGVDRGYDSVTARLRPGELVLTRQQQRSIQSRAGSNVFAEIGVGNSTQQFQLGGYVRAEPGVPTINLIFEGDAAEIAGNLIVKGVTTSGGQRAIVNVIKTSRRNGDL